MRIMRLFILFLMCCLTIPTFAQLDEAEWNAVHDKMMQCKYEFLQKELNFDANQMQKFWVVYKRYDKEILDCHLREAKTFYDLTGMSPRQFDKCGNDTFSDTVLLKLLDVHCATGRQLSEIEERYINEYKSVMPLQKILKLHALEKVFMRKMMTEVPCNKNSKENACGSKDGGKEIDRNKKTK